MIKELRCSVCFVTEERMNIKEMRRWERQHYHFKDGELMYMTCPVCKEKSQAEQVKEVMANIAQMPMNKQ